MLSLSLRRHYRQVFPDQALFETRKVILRIGGYVLLPLALLPCIRVAGAAMGTCLWISIVALAAFIQIMLLTYASGRAR
jgi:hypothetical protein